MRLILAIFHLTATFSLLTDVAAAGHQATQLRFRRDGTFKIVLFADLHYGENTTYDLQANYLQRNILYAENPDFVVYGGDQVSGWEGKGRSGWIQARWEQLTRPAREFGVHYAMILGNHDDEANLGRRELVDLDQELGAGLSLTQQGPDGLTGATNYWIDIVGWPSGTNNSENDSGSNGQETDDVAARLWFFDSMNRGCRGVKDSWGCVGLDTVDWMRETASSLPEVPSVAFVHIPLPEMMLMWDASDTFGRKGEPTNCPRINSRLFPTAQQVGIGAIFSGHDHNNDYIGEFGGILLGYNRKSGVGGYGPDGRSRGSRVISLKRGVSPRVANSWITNELGQREDQTWRRGPKWPRQEECRSGAVRVQSHVCCCIIIIVIFWTCLRWDDEHRII